MEVGEALGQQDRLQLLAEKRKRQTEIENKKRQLEDDKRALQHLKSKALRERWLLDGAPPAGQEQDEAKSRLEQNEAETRTLEDTINRLERELVDLETGALCETIIQTAVSPGSVTAVEVEGHSICLPDPPAVSGQVVQEVKVHKSSRVNKPREMTEEMKKAMYSVEIKVERDRVTGETRVLSTNTTLPVDFSHHGVKVYEDERKVVHEMNGEDGVQLLSVTEVEELIHKADEASMMSQTVATVPSLPTEEVQEEEEEPQPILPVPAEITGLETKPSGEPSVEEASAEKPVTMVFMGYQNVEDEDETKKVLGLQGTVKAELVLIDDYNGKTPPSEGKEETAIPPIAAPPTSASTPLIPSTKTPDTTSAASNGETAGEAGEVKGGAVQIKKEKQPCKCCSIM
ncbi:paralemmin 1a isoform X1 [Notolabrus celidotus]|uniref:paralemmin 1a isoform X1 n=1 Tax=Notolabrus celidotus TaxID=1203425 RepID=UPI0014903099|nr:paralemmin 1a isoform X1 [Notolabrus celidotus]